MVKTKRMKQYIFEDVYILINEEIYYINPK